MKHRYIDCIIIGGTLILIHSAGICFAKLDPNESKRQLEALEVSFEMIRDQVQIDETIGQKVIVAFATSMDKILPRGGARPLQVKSQVELKLARNERVRAFKSSYCHVMKISSRSEYI